MILLTKNIYFDILFLGENMENLNFFGWFLLFILYSCMGWIIEVIKVKIEDKKWINRGFLIGPYCPIYGISALIMANYLNNYKSNIITVFILALFVCSVVEYLVSFIMEKLFKTRWWDYSNNKFNLEGRICLENCFYFGLLGVILVYFIHPSLIRIINNMNVGYLKIISTITLLYFLFDVIISFLIINKIKDNYNTNSKDMTEDLTEERKNIIKNEKRKLQRRLIKAFPDLKPIIKK